MATAKPLKLGAKVSHVRRNGEKVEGVITNIEAKPNGSWVTLNYGSKKEPQTVTARESAVTRI